MSKEEAEFFIKSTIGFDIFYRDLFPSFDSNIYNLKNLDNLKEKVSIDFLEEVKKPQIPSFYQTLYLKEVKNKLPRSPWSLKSLKIVKTFFDLGKFPETQGDRDPKLILKFLNKLEGRISQGEFPKLSLGIFLIKNSLKNIKKSSLGSLIPVAIVTLKKLIKKKESLLGINLNNLRRKRL